MLGSLQQLQLAGTNDPLNCSGRRVACIAISFPAGTAATTNGRVGKIRKNIKKLDTYLGVQLRGAARITPLAMQKKSISTSAFFNSRTLMVLLLCAATACFILISTRSGLAVLYPQPPASASQRTLTFPERVSYQRAIEDVYWRHRIWERPDPKPSLDAVMSQAQLEKKVADYLRNSQALEDYWQRPITAEQLQAEMDRMAQHTKQPDVLRELFEALGNDPFVIAECLARPALADRLLTNWYACDERTHNALRQRAEADLLAHNTVDQMTQTSGNYGEIELVKSEIAGEGAYQDVERDVKLDSRQWDETVQKLAATFGEGRSGGGRTGFESADFSAQSKNDAAEAYEAMPIAKLSALQEDEESYYATAVIKKTSDRLKLATVAWSKEPLESWIATAEEQVSTVMAAPGGSYTLPRLSGDTAGCTVNTWAATSMNAPRGRFNPTAVWTGSEMIVWGGYEFVSSVLFNTGGRYNPSTDTWVATTTNNAPAQRTNHTAVWTGTEMIIWGGNVEDHSLKTGGRCNPTTNSWTATSTINAPHYRTHHTAVWTGTEMIIWGRTDSYVTFNSGGRYNPSTNTWVSTSVANAPQARYLHTAIWTGRRMIVWGGNGDGNFCTNLNSGGRYDPSTNTWAAISTVNAPEARWFHTAVWTGRAMIVWGGLGSCTDLNTGGRYNPTTNTWSSTATTNAPARRDSHSAIWTGTEMIVWGGFVGSGDTKTGGRYNPGTNSWTATNTNNAPSARETHTAIWTGTEMIVWGGGNTDDSWGLSTGGRYSPTTNTWVTTNGNAPTARSAHTAVWTGTEMIVWGGQEANLLVPAGGTNTGRRFSPSTDTWIATRNNNAPPPRTNHTAVWSGTEMIVWGGYFRDVNGEHFLNTGGRYDAATNSWTATSTANGPTGRDLHTAIWTGNEMIVWGGTSNGVTALNTGGRYNPNTNSWRASSVINAPSSRYYHTGVWSGSEMIVWGGTDYINYFNTGGRYNPVANTWTPTSLTNAPSRRQLHTAVWTGSEMIVWGGNFWDGIQHYLNTGSRYNPATNSWAAASTANAPPGRENHTAVWTGSKMIVWGGYDGNNNVNTGGRYNPNTNSWAATSTINAATARRVPTAVWTGSEMIVWGGLFYVATDTGGRYCTQ
jgi:N-acetylneuraminic acid mutarotase